MFKKMEYIFLALISTLILSNVIIDQRPIQ